MTPAGAGGAGTGKICVTLTASDADGMRALASKAKEGGADLVEYRLDAMGPAAVDLPRLLAEGPLPAVVTFRLPEDGGLGTSPLNGDETKRISLLRDALRLGAAYVDIELGREAGIAGDAAGRLIVSHHNFKETPGDLAELARRIEAGPADVVKLATFARSAGDIVRHVEVLEGARKPTVSFAMGELGRASRVLCLRFGSPWTYAALDEGSPPAGGSAAAPGQIALSRMLDEYRVRRVGPKSAIYGVIGHPVGHSMSPAMLGAAFEAAGVDAVYLPFDVEADPAGFVKGMVEHGAAGFSVTIPHKIEVMAVLDEIEPAATRIGAVNTVIARDGRLTGTNTDLWGALDPIAEAAGGRDALRGMRAFVLGAGGAARAIVFGLVDGGAEVSLTDVVRERAEELARAAGAAALAPGDTDPGEFDIVANATPVGMHPKVDECPMDTSRLREGQVVFDAVYNPLETRLLREARARGCRAVRGVEMFVRQGARQFELWTGLRPPLAVMRNTVLERLGKGH